MSATNSESEASIDAEGMVWWG